MDRKKWEEAVKAWEGVKEQAEINMAQADVYIAAINAHLNNEKVPE